MNLPLEHSAARRSHPGPARPAADPSLRATGWESGATVAATMAGRLGHVLTLGLVRRATRYGLTRFELGPPVASTDDPPWCPPGSASWVIHGDRAALIGGLLALWVQALHPLALAGVMEHSDFNEDPMGRLMRTASFVTVTTFGPGSQATAACATVRGVHPRIVGTAPDGRHYAAANPDLLDWIHCALLVSIARCWLIYGTRPDPNLLDAYVAQQARVPQELGDPAPPLSWAELLERLDVHRASLEVNQQTRWMGQWLANPSLTGPLRLGLPGYRFLHAAAVAAAPPWARQLWGVTGPVLPARIAGRALLGAAGGLLEPRGR